MCWIFYKCILFKWKTFIGYQNKVKTGKKFFKRCFRSIKWTTAGKRQSLLEAVVLQFFSEKIWAEKTFTLRDQRNRKTNIRKITIWSASFHITLITSSYWPSPSLFLIRNILFRSMEVYLLTIVFVFCPCLYTFSIRKHSQCFSSL